VALGRFRRRPPISALPIGLQRDIRAFFGSYSNACRMADDLLFRAGNAEALDEASDLLICDLVSLGKSEAYPAAGVGVVRSLSGSAGVGDWEIEMVPSVIVEITWHIPGGRYHSPSIIAAHP
jgi:hypothetical protein